jgi:ATP synthase protein I
MEPQAITMGFKYKDNKVWAENLQIVMQIGLTMAGCIGFGLIVGLYLDRWLGTKGIFITMFILYGVIGGGYVVYRQVVEVMETGKKDKNGSENGNN